MTVKSRFCLHTLFISFQRGFVCRLHFAQQLRRRSFRIVGFARFHYLCKLLRAVMPCGICR